MADATLLAHDLVAERFTDALRRHVGLGKVFSVGGLAEATGIKHRTIASYHEGQATPGLDKLLAIFAALGPRFADEVLAMAGLGGAKALPRGTADSFALNAELTRVTAMIGEHLRDGRVDHRERAQQQDAVRQTVVTLQEFLNTDGGSAA